MWLRDAARNAKWAGIGAERALRRGLYRRALAPLPAADRRIVDVLTNEGACQVTLDELDLPGTAAMLEQADAAFARAESSGDVGGKSYIAHLPETLLAAHPAVFGWGLSERILRIVEHYIAAPVFYRGVVGRRDLADGQSVGTRLFHIDGEDRRIVKLIVYLNDVDAEGGPFEYVPRRLGPATHRVRYVDSRVSDDELSRHVPRDRWRPATGPAGTVMIVDTCNIWHRGRLPLARDRLSLFYAYNSTRPLLPDSAGPLYDPAPMLQGLNLSPVQRAAVQGLG